MKSIKDAIKAEMYVNNIKTDQDLFIRMTKIIDKDVDVYAKYNKDKGNFSKKIKGERDFNQKEIIALESIFSKSMYEMLSETKTNFINQGIRYAAYNDKLELYEKLITNRTIAGDSPLFNYDEYNKHILDYIIEYKSINGLRFLIENDFLKINYNCVTLNGGYLDEDYIKDILELINDDIDLFIKFFPVDYNSVISINNLNLYDKFAEIVIKNKRLLLKLIKKVVKLNPDFIYGRENETINTSLFIHPLVNHIINNYLNVINEEYLYDVFDKIIDTNNKINHYIKINNIAYEELDDNGNFKNKCVVIGNCVYIKNNSNFIFKNKYQVKLNVINQQIRDFKEKNYEKRNELRIENNMIVVPNVNNPIMYEMLDNFKEKDTKFIPKLIKSDNKFDYFEYVDFKHKNVIFDKFEYALEVFKELGNFHKICMKLLGENKVYCHGNLNHLNIVFSDNKFNCVFNWKNTFIDSPYYDFIYYFIESSCIFIPYYLDKVSVDSLVESIEAYGADDKFKCDFADKMLEFISIYIKQNEENKNNYIVAEAWVKMNKEEITKKIG